MMKKQVLIILLVFIFSISIACQTATNLIGSEESDNTEVLITKVVETPTALIAPTEKVEEPQLPTEGWIAVHQERNIWVIHPDGSGLKQVTSFSGSDGAHIWDAKWSPDGKTLAFVYDRNLYTMDVQTFSQELLVKNTGGDFDWSPDGSKIIYDSPQAGPYDPWNNDGLWVVELATGQKKREVKSTREFASMSRPQWSSDGQYILFQISCMEVCPYGVVDLNTGNSLALPLRHMAGGWGHQCKWAPEQSIISCIQTSPKALAIFDPQGRVLQEIPLSINVLASQWMPDGNSMVLGYSVDDKEQMDILSLEDGSQTFLSMGSPRTWSPDGDWIIATDDSYAYPSENLFIANPETGASQPLTDTVLGIVDWQPSAFETPNLSDAVEETGPSVAEQGTNDDEATGVGECATLTITVLDTPKGDYYQICAEGIDYYEVGPLEKGDYAIGPNEKFFVYISNSGLVYAHRIGTTGMKLIGDISGLSIIAQNKDPELEFEFYGDHPYTVQIFERIFEEYSDNLAIPRYITTLN